MWAVSAGSVVLAASKIRGEAGEKKVPVMAVAGAFVFAAQMINFTIPATGSSGHIGGGILLAGLLGPFPALLTIAAVLLIQSLFFADGGILALGCNIFNMGIIPALLVYPLIFKPLVKKGLTPGRIGAASMGGAVIGLQLGAFAVVLETLFSGITALPFYVFVLLMQPIHLAIGIVEGIVTALVLSFVHQMRPEILECGVSGSSIPRTLSLKKPLILLALIALITGGVLSIFASAYPDGLEWAIEKTTVSVGTEEPEAEGALFRRAESFQESTALMKDYDLPGGEGSPVGTAAAGIVGALITAAVAGAAGFAVYLAKRKSSGGESAA
jgi:cobalt/nickel transport system permease protein